MTDKDLTILTRLKACANGIKEVEEAGGLVNAWETTDNLRHMMWLLGALHVAGRITRQRLVRVLVRLAETCAHLAPPDVLPLLADVSAWADGDDTVDLAVTRYAMSAARDAAYDDAAAYAAYAAYAAHAAADAAQAADAAALCDVVRDEFPVDELARVIA